MSQSPDWDRVAYVQASRYRALAVNQLKQGPATPSDIADETSVPFQAVSRALTQLRERDIVELLVSDDTVKGRIYDLTDVGENAAELMEAME